MNDELQKAAVRRCASELSRAIWYYRAWKALQEVERDDTANFIRLAELAMGDQMVTHVIKVLRNQEEAGFWRLCRFRKDEVRDICRRLNLDLAPVKKVGERLQYIRNKTHFHLDEIGVKNPKAIWKEKGGITHNEFDAALETSAAVVRELYQVIMGEPYVAGNYDGSDAKAIAEHANAHDLIYRERCPETARWWAELFEDED
ncbi:hypothetical protein SAMN04488061_0964 [Filomicrobium insigne]|uniref:HEPN AbiU2-like domain-containing protein n=1 Tax=Filomicrobium insigne TaxID=418854 RepID=A0A1H0IUC3_9HYPH|nr:hypothetical protein [Filomicrobium insigne]SDO35086.1 hypothetical protein SAMN04488061_0964 [Filomicrobium insigne]